MCLWSSQLRFTHCYDPGEYGFSSPDLMIVHRRPPTGQWRSPVELEGFPPWQMRLTEI